MRYVDKEKTITVIKLETIVLNGRKVNVYEFRCKGIFAGRYTGKTIKEAIDKFWFNEITDKELSKYNGE